MKCTPISRLIHDGFSVPGISGRGGMRIAGVVLLLCPLLVPSSSVAQTVTGAILGAVTDGSGAVVPAAEVVGANTETGFSRSVRTGADGNYRLGFLPPGVYRVSASAAGFKHTVRENIRVSADERIQLDVPLQVGEASQSIEVTGGPPLVQSNDATVGEVVDSTRISDLPLNGRNFVDLVQLTAGVSPGRPAEAGGETTIDNFRGRFTFNANGQRSTTNNFILDGVDNNANLFNSGGVVIAPVVDAIQEFKVSTANFSPEFGRAAGAVVSVQTKSGGNRLHGNLFEFLRNSDLDANRFFNNRAGVSRPPFRQNQFGGTVGGPIRRDRTFYFADYQGFRVRDSLTFVSNVPRPDALQGDFSSSAFRTIYDPATALPDGAGGVRLEPFAGNLIPAARFDPVAAVLKKFYPAPNTNRAGTVLNYINNPGIKRSDDQFDIRIDHRFNDATNLFGRYSYGAAERQSPNSLLSAGNPFGGGGAGNVSRIPAQSLAINLIRTWTPRLVSETRLGFTRTKYVGRPLGFNNPALNAINIPNWRYSNRVGVIPSIGVSGITNLGPQANVPNDSVQNNYQLVQNLVYIRGKHAFKAGGDILRRQLNNDFNGFTSGQFSIDGSYTTLNARPGSGGGNAVADFLLGYYASSQRDILFGGFGRRSTLGSWYVQDDVKPMRRLTVNLGVRWDVWTPLYEVHDRQSNFDRATGRLVLASPDGPLGRGLRATDWNNYAPRFGFAYDLGGSQGGYSLILRGGYSISYLEDLSAGRTLLTLNPPFAFNDQTTNAQGIIPRRTLRDGFNSPSIPSITSGLAGNVALFDTGFRSSYVQSWSLGLQRQLSANTAIDVAYVGTKGTRLLLRLDANRALPGPGAVAPRRPYYALYPSLGQLDGVSSNGNSTFHSIQLKATKRYSSGSQFLVTYTFGKAIENGEGVGGAGHGAGSQTMAQDALNQRAEKSLASYDMHQRVVVSYLYELPFGPGKGRLPSGVVSQALRGWRVQGITSLLAGNPFSLQVAASNLNTGTYQRPNRVCDGSLPRSERSIDRYFDTSCFVVPALYTFGNAARNVLVGPGTVNFDASLARTFRIGERWELEFRGDAFNLANTPHFYAPNVSLGNADFGRIGEARPDVRQIQFALKLKF